jgi:hypothetical protein
MAVYFFGTGWISTSHGRCWPLSGVVPCFVSRLLCACFVVLAREGRTTVDVVWMLNVVVIVTEFVRKRLWLVEKRTMLV